MADRQQQSSSIRINPELIKKIKQLLETNPNLDQNKLCELLQGDQTLRLKKQIIKSGVVQYFRKYLSKQEQQTKQKPLASSLINPLQVKTGAIDLTIQTLKKKVKKNQQSYQFEDNPQKYKFQNLGGIEQLKKQLDETLFQFVNNQAVYKQLSTIINASYNKQSKQSNNTINNNPNNNIILNNLPNSNSTINKTKINNHIQGYLISGSVGCGKTILANCILSELNKKLYSCFWISSYQLMGNDADEKIKKIFEAMEEKMPAVLCIDNVQEITSKEANKRSQSSSLATLSLYMDKSTDKEFIYLATTSSPQKLDALTKPGRFYKTFKILNPTQQQRTQILTKNLKNYKHSLTEKDISEIVKLTSGYVAVDLTSFIQEAMNKCVKRIINNIQSEKNLIFEDFINASKEVQPVLKREGFAKIPTTKLSDIGALEHIKQALINQIILPMKSRQKFRKLNFQINGGGVLLYGPPGCGKTMLAKGIANQANVNFITVKGPQLLTKYVGQSQQAVRKVFERARSSAPSVIFFDQFDALAPKRQDSGNQVTERVVNTLLNELNGIDDRKMIFVIAATNRPDIIDQAVLRSGRIQLKLEVPMPSHSDRQQILQKITSKVGKQEEIDIKMIAERTQKFSGADLAYLVKKSIISAVANDREGIRNQDLLDAIECFKKDNVFSKKPEMIVEEEQQQNKEFSYHPQDQLKPKKLQSNQSQEIDNELQKNIKKPQKTKQGAEGILNQFINFLVQKSKKK